MIARFPRSCLRALAVALSAALALAGCYTTQSTVGATLQRPVGTTHDALIVATDDGSTVRIDPGTEIRFMLRSGEVTRWVRGKELWRSPLGISFEEGKQGVFFLGWNEIAAAEVRNLSGGKTFGAIMLAAVIIGTVVILVLAMAKGGGGSPGGSGLGGSSGRTSAAPRSVFASRPMAHRRLLPRGHGVHVHVPLFLAVPPGPGPYYDVPPPPPAPMPPAPMPPAPMPPAPMPAPGSQAVVDIQGPAPAPPPPTASPAFAQPPTVSSAPAAPLFSPRTQRRASIRLFGSAAAGTDLTRTNGMVASLVAGMRVSEALDLGAGLRLSLDPESLSSGGERYLSVIGFGRFGTHLDLDNAKRFAIALSLDVGAGSNVVVHGSINFGLRFAPIPYLNIGLLPFNPTFTLFKDGPPLDGRKYWTFPSSVEVGFNF